MTLHAEDLTAVRWDCVHFSREVPSPERLRDQAIRVRSIDGAGVEDKAGLMSVLAEALEFPSGFGANWDALNDNLRDLSWLQGGGYVLVVDGAEQLWRRQPRLAGGLVESWLFTAGHWARREVPFHLVFRW